MSGKLEMLQWPAYPGSTRRAYVNGRVCVFFQDALATNSSPATEPLALNMTVLEQLTSHATSHLDRNRHNPRLTEVSAVNSPLFGGLGVASACSTYLPSCPSLHSVTLHFVTSLMMAAPIECLRELASLRTLNFVIISPQRVINATVLFWTQFTQRMKSFTDVPGVCTVHNLKVSVLTPKLISKDTSVSYVRRHGELTRFVDNSDNICGLIGALPSSLRRLEFNCCVRESGFMQALTHSELQGLTCLQGINVYVRVLYIISLIYFEFFESLPLILRIRHLQTQTNTCFVRSLPTPNQMANLKIGSATLWCF